MAAGLGITGTSQAPIDYGPPCIGITSFGTLSDGIYQLTRPQTLSFNDNVTYVWKRKHNLQFGYMVRVQDSPNNNEQSARGQFSFNGQETAQYVNGVAVPNTGYGFADFLLGLPYTSTIQLATNDYLRNWATAGFAQDDYRVARGLTVNVGLRYEYFAPDTEKYGRLADMVLNPQMTQAALVLPQNGKNVDPYTGQALPSSLVFSQKTMFSPRVGVAWRPSQKHSTNFRAGYSIFHSGGAYGTMANNMIGQPPFTENLINTTCLAQVNCPANSVPLTLENGFPPSGGVNTFTNTWAINPNYKTPYAQNWTFTVAQTLPHNVLLETEYIGTKGTDLGVAEAPAVSATGAAIVSNTKAFSYNTWGANSTYNAGQARVTRRFSTGHVGDCFIHLLQSHRRCVELQRDGRHSGAEHQLLDLRARAFQLRPTAQVIVYVYAVLSSGCARFHAQRWMENPCSRRVDLAGNLSMGHGDSADGDLGGAQSNAGGLAAVGGAERAEVTGLPLQGGPGQYFNPLAFTTPPPGQLGNAGVDTITGPVQISLNAQINRAWRIGESRRQLQFRLSATNALNHVTITGFGTAVASSTYDVATQASATRTVTAMFRFNF